MPAWKLVTLKNQKCLDKKVEIRHLTDPTETVNQVRAVPNMFFSFFEISLNLTVHLMRRKI